MKIDTMQTKLHNYCLILKKESNTFQFVLYFENLYRIFDSSLLIKKQWTVITIQHCNCFQKLGFNKYNNTVSINNH